MSVSDDAILEFMFNPGKLKAYCIAYLYLSKLYVESQGLPLDVISNTVDSKPSKFFFCLQEIYIYFID